MATATTQIIITAKDSTAAAFASIEGELTRLYEALAARDLAAGSPATRRLFS